jgi:uncharacterized protein (TIGR04255 family)
MHFQDVDREEYEKNILFEVVFQARFPEIIKIAHEEPTEFQDIIRKEGYPELARNLLPTLPQEMPEEIKKIISTDREFFFFSEDKNWQVSLAKDFIALACKGNYKNYNEFSARLSNILTIFNGIYEPAYFTRIGLRYKNIANKEHLNLDKNIRQYIPNYIFPELTQPIAEDIKTLEKATQFDDGTIKASVIHVLTKVSGKFGQIQINDQESYIIDIDCFNEIKTRGIDNVLTTCGEFKRYEWNIFRWSIKDDLRFAMQPR